MTVVLLEHDDVVRDDIRMTFTGLIADLLAEKGLLLTLAVAPAYIEAVSHGAAMM